MKRIEPYNENENRKSSKNDGYGIGVLRGLGDSPRRSVRTEGTIRRTNWTRDSIIGSTSGSEMILRIDTSTSNDSAGFFRAGS